MADAPSVETAAEAHPLSLRPSRRPLLWTVPAMAAVFAGWVFLWDYTGHPFPSFLSGYLILLGVYLLVLAVKLLTARTEADADGLRNRMYTKTTNIPWSDVQLLFVVPTLFGKIAHVTRTNGKRVRLAAPREGLFGRDPEFDASMETMGALAAETLPRAPEIDHHSYRPTVIRLIYVVPVVILTAAGVFMTKPWLEPWWPTRHEATTLPRACSLVDTSTLRRMVPPPKGNELYRLDSSYSWSESCGWSNHNTAGLHVEIDLGRRSGSDSGTTEARHSFAFIKESEEETSEEATATKVSGLGDQAWRIVKIAYGRSTDDYLTDVRLVVRHKNVVIEVHYWAERPESQAVADTETLARSIIRQIPIG